MAIDHVRVYSGVPAGGPTAGVFFTRWVTHFCAPGFVFLAGTAAFLYGRKVGDRYYLLHIPLIHVLALIAWTLRDGQAHSEWFVSAPYVSVDPAARWGLPLLYLVFVIAVVVLYFPCRWFAAVKARNRHGGLRYI